MSKIKTFIHTTGSYLPETRLTNSELESMVDTNDEWIVSRTGIKERRIAAKEEFTSDLGVKAARAALDKAGVPVSSLDLIVVATLSPDHIFPSTACIIQKKLGASCPAFDVGAACSGMLFALATAKGYISSGQYKNVLVIAAEKVSSSIDYTDRSTCVLFGDGAAAVLLTKDPLNKHSLEIGDIVLGSDGLMHDSLEIPSGGVFEPSSEASLKNKGHYLKMDGKVVYKHAIKRMSSSLEELMRKAGLEKQDIDYFIPHQANDRIIEALLKRFVIDGNKVHKNVHSFGNTCAASVGICLDEYLNDNNFEDRNVLLTTFGAGFTWGSMHLKREL